MVNRIDVGAGLKFLTPLKMKKYFTECRLSLCMYVWMYVCVVLYCMYVYVCIYVCMCVCVVLYCTVLYCMYALHMYLRTYVCMWPSLASERSNRLYSRSIFKSLPITGRSPVNMNILASKIKVFQIGPKNKMANYSKMVQTTLISFHEFVKTITLSKTAWAISSEK
jgi:hypothetical protein